tara:strand:- start:2743 stop:3009 length:267 start_codon:yes stop_codon:yes gene_type:complete
MAKFSKKQGGKEVGGASVYAQPHTMSGKAVGISSTPGKEPNRSKLDSLDVSVGNISKSAGNESVKTDGIKMRGTGAATKGVMSRGPMA